jgi:hypothetical protein
MRQSLFQLELNSPHGYATTPRNALIRGSVQACGNKDLTTARWKLGQSAFEGLDVGARFNYPCGAGGAIL